ncbi:hypothetical protein V1508DRAFT_397805 [Lipomyces doorenjongii]|uniref:uncharacterized protein n=1 Tax=Lipomyces doorenjongii TaxID=383834 RepID=UPI0034CE3492
MSSSASITATPAVTSTIAEIADPDFFNGERKKLHSFLAQLTLKLRVNRAYFRDESVKVGYATSRLRGPGSEWLRR